MTTTDTSQSLIPVLTDRQKLDIKAAHAMIHALCSRASIRIIEKIQELDPYDTSGVTVTQIWTSMRLSQHSTASTMLGNLRRAGILYCEKRGKEVYYYIHYERLDKVTHFCKKIKEMLHG